MRAQIQEIMNDIIDEISELDEIPKVNAAALLQKLEAAIRPQWVPVAERLPDSSRMVFAAVNGEYVSISRTDQIAKFGSDVTHWHEIDYPEPPESSQ